MEKNSIRKSVKLRSVPNSQCFPHLGISLGELADLPLVHHYIGAQGEWPGWGPSYALLQQGGKSMGVPHVHLQPMFLVTCIQNCKGLLLLSSLCFNTVILCYGFLQFLPWALNRCICGVLTNWAGRNTWRSGNLQTRQLLLHWVQSAFSLTTWLNTWLLNKDPDLSLSNKMKCL